MRPCIESWAPAYPAITVGEASVHTLYAAAALTTLGTVRDTDPGRLPCGLDTATGDPP